MTVVPVSQSSLVGAVPSLAGGATAVGLANARPRATADLAPAQSFVPWNPPLADDLRLPCVATPRKGGTCGMARAYDEDGTLTVLCKSHWSSVFLYCSQALVNVGQAWASPPPD